MSIKKQLHKWMPICVEFTPSTGNGYYKVSNGEVVKTRHPKAETFERVATVAVNHCIAMEELENRYRACLEQLTKIQDEMKLIDSEYQ